MTSESPYARRDGAPRATVNSSKDVKVSSSKDATSSKVHRY